MLAIAIFIAAVATRIIPVDETSIYVPRWILLLVSGIFALAAVLTLVGRNSRAGDLLAAFMLLSMAVLGGWISIFGSAENIAGGLILLPAEANSVMARVLFGFGAILTLSVSAYAVRRVFKGDTGRIAGADAD